MIASAATTQSYTIAVRAGDQPPVITSSPPLSATWNQVYAYAVQASDADGDALTYSLLSGSPGA